MAIERLNRFERDQSIKLNYAQKAYERAEKALKKAPTFEDYYLEHTRLRGIKHVIKSIEDDLKKDQG